MSRSEILKLLKANRLQITDSMYSRNTENYHLEDLLELVPNVFIPPFQRDIEWTEKHMCALLNFLLTGETSLNPIHLCRVELDQVKGSYYNFYKRSQRIEHTPKGAKSEAYAYVYSIIDGLQRLTTLSSMTSGVKTTRIHFNLHSNEFEMASRAAQHKVPVHIILMRDKIEGKRLLKEYLKGQSPTLKQAYIDNAEELRSRIYFYQYKVSKTDPCDVLKQKDLFISLNSGKSISQVQKTITGAMSTGWKFHEYCDSFIDNMSIFFRDESKAFIRKPQTVSLPSTALTAAFCVLEDKSECCSPIGVEHILRAWGSGWTQGEHCKDEVMDKLNTMTKWTLAIAQELSRFLRHLELRSVNIKPMYLTKIAVNNMRVRYITVPQYLCILSFLVWYHRGSIRNYHKSSLDVRRVSYDRSKTCFITGDLDEKILAWIFDFDFVGLDKPSQKSAFCEILKIEQADIKAPEPHYNPKDSAKRRIILK